MPTPEPSLLLEPVQRLLTHLSDPAAPRRLIALAGLPGSGKSTVAQRWVDRVNEAHSAARSANAGIEANSERAEMAEKPGHSAAAVAHPDAPATPALPGPVLSTAWATR